MMVSVRTAASRPGAGFLVATAFCACLLGPSVHAASEQPQEEDGTLARVGEEVITVAEFSAEMARRGGGRRGQYTSVDQRKALLEEMIRERLMVAEAKRQGLDRSPEVLAAARRVLITQMSRTRLQPLLEQVTVNDEEVRAAYDANRDMYRTPERIRGAIIEFRKPNTTDETTRTKFVETVAAVHEDALELPADSRGFGELARRYSDDRASRYIGGMLPWLYAGQDYKWGPEVVGALFALDSPGDVGPIVETQDSVFLVRLAERDGSRQLGFDRYSAGIRNQLVQIKRELLRESYYQSLEQELNVERDLGALATLPAPPVTRESQRTLPSSPTKGPSSTKGSGGQ